MKRNRIRCDVRGDDIRKEAEFCEEQERIRCELEHDISSSETKEEQQQLQQQKEHKAAMALMMSDDFLERDEDDLEEQQSRPEMGDKAAAVDLMCTQHPSCWRCQ